MDVVAYLSPVLLTQLRVALGPGHRLQAVSDWRELERVVRRCPVDVLVLDPLADGGDGTADVRGLLTRHPSLPVVLYVSLSPASLRTVVELARHGLEQVVLHRFDDEPRRFRELLESRVGGGLTEELLHELAPTLAQLPPSLAGAIRRMFRQPHLVWTAQDLAAAAGMPRRTMYRQLESAGFTSPRLLVQGARLLRAYIYLRDPGHLVEDVVVKLRYGSPHVFIRHTRETCGLTPSALRRKVEGTEFVALLARRLLAG